MWYTRNQYHVNLTIAIQNIENYKLVFLHQTNTQICRFSSSKQISKFVGNY